MRAHDETAALLQESLPKLRELMDGYRQALLFVHRHSGIKFLTAHWRTKKKGDPALLPSLFAILLSLPRKLVQPYMHTVYIQLFVKPFVEAHIRAKVRIMLQYLRIEGLSATEESLEWHIRRLEELRQALSGWSQLRVFTIALFSLLAPFLSLERLLNLEVSETLSSIGTYVPLFLFLALYIIFYILVVQFGFRWKRVIFLCGREELESPWDTMIKEATWDDKDFPRTNIYEMEDQVFKEWGLLKPKEFPLDLVINPWPYLSLGFTVLLWVYLVQGWSRLDEPGVVIGPAFFSFLPLVFFWVMIIRPYVKRPK